MNDLMRFSCPKCGKRLKAAIEHAGRKARCSCGDAVIVPRVLSGTAPADEAIANRWTADAPTMTTLRPRPDQRVGCTTVPSGQSPTWHSVVSGAPNHSSELRYRGNIRQIWQSILEYVQKLPDLTVLQSTEVPLQLIYQSKHFRQIIIVNVAPASKSGETDVAVHLFSDSTQPETAGQKNPAMKLFAYVALKTQALDPKFRQTAGAGAPREVRASGVWKMAGGAVICLVGLILTALSKGQVLFYGAIIWGGFMFIAGAVQAVVGRNVD